MKGLKHVILMSLALGMLFYSLPRMKFNLEFSLSTTFTIVWVSLALLIVAAHLHEILGVEDDQPRQVKTEHVQNSPVRGKN
jgi:hypothetical protein